MEGVLGFSGWMMIWTGFVGRIFRKGLEKGLKRRSRKTRKRWKDSEPKTQLAGAGLESLFARASLVVAWFHLADCLKPPLALGTIFAYGRWFSSTSNRHALMFRRVKRSTNAESNPGTCQDFGPVWLQEFGEFMSGGIWRIWNAGIQNATKFILNSNSLFDSFRNSSLRIQYILNF